MARNSGNSVLMDVWCTLLPPEELHRFAGQEEGLRTISEAYEDWLSTMGSKSVVGADTGVLLDRIRILMINIGIACALDRELAEEVQNVLSEHLRQRALQIVEEMKEDTSQANAVKQTLAAFFQDLRFTRDIFPEEEIEGVIPEKVLESGKRGILGRKKGSKKVDTEDALQSATVESANILKKIYMRLVSPDPWGTY